MRRNHKETARRRAGSLGAVSLRIVVALGASTGLTAAVALPMAYQAQQAREQDQVAREPQPSPEVLGSTTVPSEPDRDATARHDGLYWVASTAPSEVPSELVDLHRSTLTGSVQILVDLPGIERVDFRLNDGPVVSVRAEPWQFPEDGPLDSATLGEGAQALVTTIEFDDGRIELREAEFTVSTN